MGFNNYFVSNDSRRVRCEFSLESFRDNNGMHNYHLPTQSHHGFCAVPTNTIYGIEVSTHRQRTPVENEETHITISPYQSSPRMISIGSDSTNAGSISAPC
ncbi:hypothetical protein ACFX2I_026461 [Malus domestica]